MPLPGLGGVVASQYLVNLNYQNNHVAPQRRPRTMGPAPSPAVRFGSHGQLDASIPVLDMAVFRNAKTEAQRNAFARHFGQQFQKYGFIALKNHGVPKALIDKHFDAFNRLMQRPESTLMPYHFPSLDLGFVPEERKPDGKGGYSAIDPKRMWHTRSKAAVYPPDAPEFAELNLALFKGLRNAAFDVTDILSRYIGGRRGQILRDYAELSQRNPGQISPDNSLLRSIRYMALDAQQRQQARQIQFNNQTHVVRTGEHRDMSLFTLLPQATDSGLQLFTREREFPKGHPQYNEMLKDDKNWLDVHAQDGYLILNAGDVLDFMTDGLKDRQGRSKHIIATTHRVLASDKNLETARISIPFFFQGNFDKPIIHLKTGKPVLRPEPLYEGQPFDNTYQMTYRRLRRAAVIPPHISFNQYVADNRNYAETVQRSLRERDLATAFHAGIPL